MPGLRYVSGCRAEFGSGFGTRSAWWSFVAHEAADKVADLLIVEQGLSEAGCCFPHALRGWSRDPNSFGDRCRRRRFGGNGVLARQTSAARAAVL